MFVLVRMSRIEYSERSLFVIFIYVNVYPCFVHLTAKQHELYTDRTKVREKQDEEMFTSTVEIWIERAFIHIQNFHETMFESISEFDEHH